jgi:hypothetical protein
MRAWAPVSFMSKGPSWLETDVGNGKFYGKNKKPPARPEVGCAPLCNAARYVVTTRMMAVAAFIASHPDRSEYS